MLLTLSDWYHDFMPDLIARFLAVTNPTGAEPVPDSALMNDTQDLKINVQPNKTYMLRIINMAAFAPQYLWFENHTMTIVEVDGIYTEPTDAEMIYITPAQRYSVLIKTKNDTSANFPIVGSMDQVSPSTCRASLQAADRNRTGPLRQDPRRLESQRDGLARLR